MDFLSGGLTETRCDMLIRPDQINCGFASRITLGKTTVGIDKIPPAAQCSDFRRERIRDLSVHTKTGEMRSQQGEQPSLSTLNSYGGIQRYLSRTRSGHRLHFGIGRDGAGAHQAAGDRESSAVDEIPRKGEIGGKGKHSRL